MLGTPNLLWCFASIKNVPMQTQDKAKGMQTKHSERVERFIHKKKPALFTQRDAMETNSMCGSTR